MSTLNIIPKNSLGRIKSILISYLKNVAALKQTKNSLSVFIAIGALFFPFISNAAVIYVSPLGSDTNLGSSLSVPLKTIQKALDLAQPNDTIELAPGQYLQDIVSKRNGTVSSPITIKGPADAIVKGAGNPRVIEINHDYHVLTGFTLDGLFGDPKKSSGYRDILIMALGKETKNGVEGLKITNMSIKNAGGECIRLRYFATKAEIAHNTITSCGVRDFVFGAGGKNGEGVYIGTSNKQWSDGKNPTSDPDESRDNVVHHNYIDTQGNECVDIKEGSTDNIVEYNTCRGQKDSESGGFDSRGDGNVFRYNDVRSSVGAGVRLGGALVGSFQYGKNNDVYGNTILDNKNGGIRFQVSPQRKICGNVMSGNTGGNSVGDFGLKFDPSKDCGDSTTPPTTPPPSDTLPPQLNPNSLANSNTLSAYSNNFSAGYEPAKLWDGCYEESSYSSNTCTSGGRDMGSFWLEFDFKKNYELSQIRLYGDADGEWVSKTWAVHYKNDSSSQWTTIFSGKNAFINGWLTEAMNVKTRYLKVEVVGDNIKFSLGRTQARELEIFGKEITEASTSVPTPSTSSNSNGNGSGGGGSIVSQPTSTPSYTGNVSNQSNNKSFTKNINLGSYSSEVTKLQQFLSQDKSLYPEGLVTGYYGLLTKTAVQKFQCKYQIVCEGDEEYGVVGQKTLAKLNEVYPQTSSTQAYNYNSFTQRMSFGSQGNKVTKLQQFLSQDKSLYPEGLVTGYYGLLTKTAVQKFQCKYQIVCEGDEEIGYGVVGPRTLAKLSEVY